jgi:hypothetical protein
MSNSRHLVSPAMTRGRTGRHDDLENGQSQRMRANSPMIKSKKQGLDKDYILENSN